MEQLTKFIKDIKQGKDYIQKIKHLVGWLFPDSIPAIHLTDTQAEIIKIIVFDECKRL